MSRYSSALIAIAAIILSTGCYEPELDLTTLDNYDVINGELTEEYPQVVALFFAVSMWEGGLCSGTVINDEWILTAAHCPIDGYNIDMCEIYFGPDMNDPEYEMDMEEVYVNPGYNGMTGDAAVIRMSDVTPYEAIPINREPLGEELVGEAFTFVGFGQSEVDQEVVDGLKREADIEVMLIQDEGFAYYDEQQMTGHGDSGGPALWDFGEGQRVVGITSFGWGDYGASTAVNDMADWIDGYTGGDAEPWGDDDDTADDDDDTADDDTAGDDDTGDDDDDGGCQCSAEPTPPMGAALSALLMVGLLVLRRR